MFSILLLVLNYKIVYLFHIFRFNLIFHYNFVLFGAKKRFNSFKPCFLEPNS